MLTNLIISSTPNDLSVPYHIVSVRADEHRKWLNVYVYSAAFVLKLHICTINKWFNLI